MSLRQTPVVLGQARFTVYSPGCVRLEYANQGRFSPYPSILVGKKLAKPQKANVAIKKKSVTIKTDALTLEYTDNGQNFSSENLKITHKNLWGGQEIWLPGKADRGNFGTIIKSLDQWKHVGGGPERFPNEGILSTQGGHFIQDEARAYWNTKENWPEVLSNDVWFDGYFFAYGSNFKNALRDFVNVFGKIPMIPRWSFGFWYSRWFAYTDKEFVDIAKKYRKEKIPMDVMVIDTDWRKAVWGGYDWSPKHFPNPKKAMKQLHDLGLHTTLNDHPGYDHYDALPLGDGSISEIRRRLGPLPHQGQYACDWSNKKAVDAWREVLLAKPFKDGMDFWWIDGWVKPPFRSADSQCWANHHYSEITEEKTKKRGMVLARWGGVGSHRYPVQFSGDTYSDWTTLRYQIEFTALSGNLGAAYWSHDIGGFFDKKVDDELFIRWVQFGSMSPIFRTHSAAGIREPWNYSDKALAIFRKQTHIRYALAPYFYTLAREAHETGLPICRPMYLDYGNEYPRVLDFRHQYGLGKDILVVPADHSGDHRKIQKKRAYFPRSVWYGLETHEVIQAIDDRWIDIPLDLIPTYIREGAIIPCQPVGENIGSLPTDEIHFDFYPDRYAKSAFELYEDDGESLDYKKNRFAKTQLTGRRQNDVITFDVSAPKGHYQGMPKQRNYVVRSRLDAGEKVARAEVKIGNRDWEKVRSRITNDCLAGTVKSFHSFAEVRIRSSNERVQIRLNVE